MVIISDAVRFSQSINQENFTRKVLFCLDEQQDSQYRFGINVANFDDLLFHKDTTIIPDLVSFCLTYARLCCICQRYRKKGNVSVSCIYAMTIEAVKLLYCRHCVYMICIVSTWDL